MGAFSWKKAQESSLKIKILEAENLARVGHPDFKNAHPDECSDAAKNNFTKLIKRVTDEHNKHIHNNSIPPPSIVPKRLNRT